MRSDSKASLGLADEHRVSNLQGVLISIRAVNQRTQATQVHPAEVQTLDVYFGAVIELHQACDEHPQSREIHLGRRRSREHCWGDSCNDSEKLQLWLPKW